VISNARGILLISYEMDRISRLVFVLFAQLLSGKASAGSFSLCKNAPLWYTKQKIERQEEAIWVFSKSPGC
jgi:hypothetical protein